VRKRVQEVTGQVTEPLISEFVETQRVPVGRVLQEPVGIRQEGEVTIVPVVEERLVLRKELVLVEEIRLTRRREEHNATEQVTLRRESVVIERFDPETQQWLSQGEG
jgi:stress response protein YsnF